MNNRYTFVMKMMYIMNGFPENRSVEIYAEGCSYVNKMNKWL